MIYSIPHTLSEGLRKENEAHENAASASVLESMRQQHPTAEAYNSAFLSTLEGKQFAHALGKRLEPGKKILDIGAGYGRSTVYLASRGYGVVALEPAPALCTFIDRLTASYGLAVDIFNAPAEAIDQLPVREFEACVFSASLHHCDDPLRALKHCFASLKPGGRIFLLNEPQLQFFRSKRWFERQLQRGTLVTGDYGGNEHIYYRHEYVTMLQEAGFVRVRNLLSNRYEDPKGYLNILRYQGKSGRSILVRQAYYGLIQFLERYCLFGRGAISVLKRLSLVQSYFIAFRPGI